MARTISSTPQTQTQASVLQTNSVLRNTYWLLALTLGFCGLTAYAATALNVPRISPILTIVVYIGLLFAIERFKTSGLGIALVFALTGFMGLTLGTIVQAYVSAIPNGHEIVALAMGGTAVIFFGLSAYALMSGINFGFMGGALVAGLLIAFVAAVGNLWLQIPALSLTVAAMFMLLSSGMILWKTSEIIHGGEDNYVSATVTLFVSIYNIFLSLLQILGIFGGDD